MNREGLPSRKQAFLFADLLNKLPVNWKIMDMEDIRNIKNLKGTIETLIAKCI